MAATEDELRLRDAQAAQRAARDQQAAGASASATPGDPANAIELRGVTKTYDVSNAGLRNATFSVRRGEFVFLVGQTGSGKSTLMRLLIAGGALCCLQVTQAEFVLGRSHGLRRG